MHPHRRIRRALALSCTTAALAAVPATAVAMPIDPTGAGDAPAVESQPSTPTVVREVQTGGGDQTLALVISGAALLVALGGAGFAARAGHGIGQPSH
jgi:hypothetical protein